MWASRPRGMMLTSSNYPAVAKTAVEKAEPRDHPAHARPARRRRGGPGGGRPDRLDDADGHGAADPAAATADAHQRLDRVLADHGHAGHGCGVQPGARAPR